ncbi:MAG: site-specific integrase [Victivallaceae bacterium]|jgi:integrase
MGLTVALSKEETAEIICWFLERYNSRIESGQKTKALAALFWGAIMAYQYLSGARITEITLLRRRQIADDECRLHPVMSRRKLKTGRKQSTITAYIDPDSAPAQVVSAWLRESRGEFGRYLPDDWAFAWGFNRQPFRRESAWRAWQKGYIALGLAYVSRGTHCVRKTAGLMQYDIAFAEYGDGMRAMQKVQRYLGHARLQTTEAYLPINPGLTDDIAHQHGAKVKLGNILGKHLLNRENSN